MIKYISPKIKLIVKDADRIRSIEALKHIIMLKRNNIIKQFKDILYFDDINENRQYIFDYLKSSDKFYNRVLKMYRKYLLQNVVSDNPTTTSKHYTYKDFKKEKLTNAGNKKEWTDEEYESYVNKLIEQLVKINMQFDCNTVHEERNNLINRIIYIKNFYSMYASSVAREIKRAKRVNPMLLNIDLYDEVERYVYEAYKKELSQFKKVNDDKGKKIRSYIKYLRVYLKENRNIENIITRDYKERLSYFHENLDGKIEEKLEKESKEKTNKETSTIEIKNKKKGYCAKNFVDFQYEYIKNDKKSPIIVRHGTYTDTDLKKCIVRYKIENGIICYKFFSYADVYYYAREAYEKYMDYEKDRKKEDEAAGIKIEYIDSKRPITHFTPQEWLLEVEKVLSEEKTLQAIHYKYRCVDISDIQKFRKENEKSMINNADAFVRYGIGKLQKKIREAIIFKYHNLMELEDIWLKMNKKEVQFKTIESLKAQMSQARKQLREFFIDNDELIEKEFDEFFYQYMKDEVKEIRAKRRQKK